MLLVGSTSATKSPSTHAEVQDSALQDQEFAAELKRQKVGSRTRWHVIANAFSVRVLATQPEESQWVEVGTGDIGSETEIQLRVAAKASELSWIDVDVGNLAQVSPDLSNPTLVPVARLKEWIKHRDRVTTGRRGEVTESVKAEVSSLAAWRCQFEGCAENLRKHLMPGSRGNFSYFAHIVAASAEGPRGDSVLSPQLANDPTNILLLCDKCHRIIDRVAPLLYSRQRLQEMRARNLASVERCLDSLRYPVARVLALGGNVQGQSAAFDESLAQEAMWLQKLRCDNTRPDWFARNAGHLGDAHSPAFWSSLFPLLKKDIPRLQSVLDGTAHDSVQGMPLAVFPAPHATSVLVLTGRLLGESRTIHLFQFHRDQVGGILGGQWAWMGAPPAKDKYKMRILRSAEPEESEATLLVHLTDSIPPAELPASFYENGRWVRPTIEIGVEQPSRRVIGHPEDLELFGLAVDDALQMLQDQWRVTSVHLLAIAPITACVRIGQKMQARCQPDFVLYERKTTGEGAQLDSFISTIRIAPQDVIYLQTGETCLLC
jgi:hypothetical protein